MNKVIHFEIPADDVSRAEGFYREVFGWKINPVPDMNYTVVHTGPTDENRMVKESGFINGGVMKRSGQFKNPVITIAVENIDEALKIIESHGGHMMQEKIAVGDMGFSAYFKDSEGNMIGLWQNKDKST